MAAPAASVPTECQSGKPKRRHGKVTGKCRIDRSLPSPTSVGVLSTAGAEQLEAEATASAEVVDVKGKSSSRQVVVALVDFD